MRATVSTITKMRRSIARLAVATCVPFLAVASLGSLASAHGATRKHCYVLEVPCLGSIETLYAFSGKAGGALHSISAKLGPVQEEGTNPEGNPIVHRTFTWRSAPNVKLVAVYILSILTEHGKAVMKHRQGQWIIQRIPTRAHSGKVTVTSTAPRDLEPDLLLEGARAG